MRITKIHGYEQSLINILSHANACLSAIFTRLARAAYEEALEHSKRRVQGGKLLCEHQLGQKRLFDTYVEVEVSRHSARAALSVDEGKPPLKQALATKVFSSQAAVTVASDTMEVGGIYSPTEGALVEKLFRDARTTTAERGTNDVLALTGARLLLGRI